MTDFREREQRVGLLSMESIGTPEHNLEGFRPLYLVTQSFGILYLVLMGIWTGWFLGGFSWRSDVSLEFNWHPLLMSVGMIFMYANSMLIYRGLRTARKRTLKLAHASVHCLAFLIIIIALIAVFDSHNLAKPTPIPNLYSLHSWLGLSAVIMFALQWVSGFAAFLYPRLKAPLRSSYLPIHIYFGVLGFVCAVTTALLGLSEKAFFHLAKHISDLPSEGLLVNFIGIILIVFATLVVYLVTHANYKRQSLPEDEVLLTGSIE